MNKLAIMHNKQAVTTSLQVAEVFGKDPAKVNRSIEQIIAETGTPKLANVSTRTSTLTAQTILK